MAAILTDRLLSPRAGSTAARPSLTVCAPRVIQIRHHDEA
jgi:hypothetical protein